MTRNFTDGAEWVFVSNHWHLVVPGFIANRTLCNSVTGVVKYREPRISYAYCVRCADKYQDLVFREVLDA